MNKKNIFAIVLVALSLTSCVTIGVDADRTDYKVVVIGSGPAGLTAGIYTARANYSTLVIEGDIPGGLLTETPEIGNWPGEKSISGSKLMDKIRNHAIHEGCKLLADKVVSVDFKSRPYKVRTEEGNTYTAQAVIIGTGAKRKKLGVPGEQKYWGTGVSVCATCDALFYKNKIVAVVGGGHTALTEAAHLARFAKQVIMIHRSERFRVADPIRDKVEKNPKIKIVHNAKVKEILGDGNKVNGIVVENSLNKQTATTKVDGVFVAIGFVPNVEMFGGQLALDSNGFIKVHDASKTSKEGVFAAGDVINRKYQQAIVAAGDGCKAALDCVMYFDKR